MAWRKTALLRKQELATVAQERSESPAGRGRTGEGGGRREGSPPWDGAGVQGGRGGGERCKNTAVGF